MFDVIAGCLKADLSKYLWKFVIFSKISVLNSMDTLSIECKLFKIK